MNPKRNERLVDLAFASTKVPDRLARGSRAIVSGVLLGLLTEAPLRALDERYYSETELYQTPAWNDRGLFPWEQASSRRCPSKGKARSRYRAPGE